MCEIFQCFHMFVVLLDVAMLVTLQDIWWLKSVGRVNSLTVMWR